jgi:hypothetical protein
VALIDVRRIFIRDFTGRYDLIVEGSDFANNGADFYINAGQRWLDRKVQHKKSPASIYTDVDVGGFYVIFTEARAVQEVWISNSIGDGTRGELTRVTRQALRELFPLDYSGIDNSTPCYYTPINVRSLPVNSLEFTIDKIGEILYTSSLGSDALYNAILLLPPTDTKITVEVVGLFYTPALVNDTDHSFWTESEPMLLVQAACRMLEVSMRNRQGVADYELAMEVDIVEIEKDDVEEEIVAIETMGKPVSLRSRPWRWDV